ncbi:gamma-glutamylcyclotransferase family protein [Mucilaginibacter sp. CSA2-8R]|uniref:gamma-glutamylcyclotransferase family protein n=1 Tax=Mucilaginibacter sp. CSA2-8R TaxID=3141542 RepID=UPI00315D5C75
MEHLFVYGTLLSHFNNNALNAVAELMQYEGQGKLKGRIFDLGAYPALITSADEKDDVQGEVYQLASTNKVLATLDEYEGDEYRRELHIVRLEGGKQIRCWVYVYKPLLDNNVIQIIGGDYLAYIRNKG